MSKKPMPILLIEDDDTVCQHFRERAGNRADLSLIGTTNSSAEGLQMVKRRQPEGVILDLELTKGKGDGMQFLTALQETKLALRPIVTVTTNIQAEVMYDSLHEMGVVFVFSKKQPGYGPDMVFNMLLNLRNSLPVIQTENKDIATVESPEERQARILELIDAELNDVGVSIRLIGRSYLRESIYYLITREKNESAAVIYDVAQDHKINYNSVIRSIQTALNNAWDRADIETLKAKYPVHIDIRTGVPAPTEFIHYYADKISKFL